MDTNDKIIENEIISGCISNDEDTLMYLDRVVKITRINRINAANRLLDTETFLQGINIYYSCFCQTQGPILINHTNTLCLRLWTHTQRKRFTPLVVTHFLQFVNT